MRWFLQMLGCKVTVLGRVGVDVILAAPLPRVLGPPPTRLPSEDQRVLVNEELARQLVRLDGLLTHALTGRPFKWSGGLH